MFPLAFDGKVFAFQGKYLWKIRNNGAASGFPKTIKSVYKKAPSNVDAVVTSHINQKTYFFKGKNCFIYVYYYRPIYSTKITIKLFQGTHDRFKFTRKVSITSIIKAILQIVHIDVWLFSTDV